MIPTVEELLLKAGATAPVSQRRAGVGEYVEIIDLLRAKGFTWKAIEDWFAAEGLPFARNTLQTAKYRGGKRRT